MPGALLAVSPRIKARCAVKTFSQIAAQNLIILDLAKDMFGVKDRDTWDKVKKRFTPEKVEEFYRRLPDPSALTIDEILPQPPAKNTLRLAYIGDSPSGRKKINEILTGSLYADQVLILDPLPPHRDVLTDGSWYTVDLFHRVKFLQHMRPLIESEYACFCPDPGQANAGQVEVEKIENQLRPQTKRQRKNERARIEKAVQQRNAIDATEKRLNQKTTPSDEEKSLVAAIAKYREDQFAAMMEYSARYDHKYDVEWGLPDLQRDPSAHYATWVKGDVEIPTLQLVSDRSRAMAYAVDARGEYYHIPKEINNPHVQALVDADMPALVNLQPRHIARLKEKGRLNGLRAAIVDVYDETFKSDSMEPETVIIPLFKDRLLTEIAKARAEMSDIDTDLVKWGGTAGALSTTSLIVAGHLTLTIGGPALAVILGTSSIYSWWKKRNLRPTHPFAPLVDLEIKQKR